MAWEGILIDLLKIVIVVVVLMSVGGLLTWVERRLSAMVQDRLGPNRANFGRFRFWGLLHPLADGLKMLWKEDFIPNRAQRTLHYLAPFIALFPALVTFAVIPFGDKICIPALGEVVPAEGDLCAAYTSGVYSLQIAKLNIGLLFIFAIGGCGIIGAIIAGWCSYNNYSLLGSLRAASQMISYEVVMGFSIIGVLMVYGTLELDEMVKWQGPYPWNWGFFVQPLAFILFFTAAIAETKRVPFDLPEGESEIVAGYFLEFSGMKFAAFFLGEFIEIVVISAIVTTLFFGGWQVPFLERDGFHIGEEIIQLTHLTVVLLQVGAFILKVGFFCLLQILLRWTLPRLRYDQLMKLSWKGLLPISIGNIIVTGGILLLVR
jgi:NADH-quinone oxidoreductase subunit H